MLLVLAVGAAAGLGAVGRLLGASLWPGPAGTFLVNISGAAVLGLVVGLFDRGVVGRAVLDVVGAGFAGGFTTLSTWAWETVTLALARQRAAALCNVLGSFALGLLAAAAGLGVGLVV